MSILHVSRILSLPQLNEIQCLCAVRMLHPNATKHFGALRNTVAMFPREWAHPGQPARTAANDVT